MKADILDKLQTLAELTKYDVSFASNGTTRKNKAGSIGSDLVGKYAQFH